MGVGTRLHSLLRWLKGTPPAPLPTLDDPTFGRIEFYGHSWGGEDLRLPGQPEHRLDVTIPGDAAGPSDEGRRRFADVVSRIGELNAQVESELAGDFARLRDDKLNRDKQFPAIKSPADIWQIARLCGIRLVQTPGVPTGEFELHYAMAWDHDHSFVAVFKDWRLTVLYKDG